MGLRVVILMLEIKNKKNSLSGASRMSTLVCCELSRAKQIVARDGSHVRFGSSSLIGAY
jgi:hypothetical protein